MEATGFHGKEQRGYYFGAGPAMLPEEILEEVRAELMNWQGQGVSILEVGHRTSAFMALMEEAEQVLRQLLQIPKHYQVLFFGGPARNHFALIPLNLLGPQQKAAYLLSGTWSSQAYLEARRVKKAYCVASDEANGYLQIPPQNSWQFEEATRYLYYVPNETVDGVALRVPPTQYGLPLVADMTSCLLTDSIKVEDYGLILAGAQKNIANAGLSLVIVDEALLAEQPHEQASALAKVFDYRTYVTSHSLYATPPTFNCYLALKMFHWLVRQGGVEVFARRNADKAQQLYSYLDNSSLYAGRVKKEARSPINVCFNFHPDLALSPERKALLEEEFLQFTKERGLLGLKGHRLVGGFRASLYNAMPIEGVLLLIEVMDAFAKKVQLR